MNSSETLSGLPHREAAGRLLASGWSVCGLGDWATVWRSPDGTQVARISPFEPAYGVFVALCHGLDGNPMLPRIDLDVALGGGGRLTVMEFLLPVSAEEAGAVAQRWTDASPGDPITQVRHEAERLDAEAATSVPFWGGLDHNPNNVMKNVHGEFKLVDLFYAAGLEIYRVLLEDPATIANRFAPHQREYICDIAAISRMSTPEEIARLQSAAASIT
ncbi:hypothetical protein [Phytoactinopolyspora limicola]|uniref:hypothetical protein n=1 Tax=Phytoactinopolyspora limicola TaxID=2715536 RepID=UPI00140DB999|nr:hypothetical protein [Phytoactinopolyspora limicola]